MSFNCCVFFRFNYNLRYHRSSMRRDSANGPRHRRTLFQTTARLSGCFMVKVRVAAGIETACTTVHPSRWLHALKKRKKHCSKSLPYGRRFKHEPRMAIFHIYFKVHGLEVSAGSYFRITATYKSAQVRAFEHFVASSCPYSQEMYLLAIAITFCRWGYGCTNIP